MIWMPSGLSFLLLLTSVLIWFYWYVQRQFSFWPRRGVPFRKPHWLMGSMEGFMKGKVSIAELYLDFYNEYKSNGFGGFLDLYSPNLLVTDLDLLRRILTKDFNVWQSRGITVNEKVDPISVNLVNIDGKLWKAMRSKLTPTFTTGKLRNMHSLLVECGTEFEKYLDKISESEKPVEAREMSAKFTTDVIGSCIFGIQMNSLSDEDATFRAFGRKIFEPTTSKRITTVIQRSFPELFKMLRLSLFPRSMSDFFIKITKDIMEYRKQRGIQRKDFMDMLMHMKKEERSFSDDDIELTDELLAAQAFVFFAAGFETSSTVISYCFHELALNQDIQQRLREEIHRRKAKEVDGQLTWDGLRGMQYLHMVVQETLRKYPPIPQLIRKSVLPYRIPNTNVDLPVGSKCIIPVYGIHHDPEYYPDPEKFDPLRFTEEAINQRPASSFIPFGDGPRICIGLRFAEQLTKVAIVHMVANYDISLCEKSQNPPQFDPRTRLLAPKGGIWINIKKRSSS